VSRLDHIGIVVDDLDEAVAFLTGTLGLAPGPTIDLPERGTRAAFVEFENASIELIELSEGEARDRRLGRGQARIEHVGIEVDDPDATFETLGGQGVEFTAPPERRVTAWDTRKYFFTKPESSDGVIYQFLGD
jgi:catechol 2,3-dioxygenase-like lactoylglutathione lyase family enzyme